LNHRDSTLFKHVFVLRVSDGQRSPGFGADHELNTQLTRYSGDEGNCAIGILAAGDLAFPLAEIKETTNKSIGKFNSFSFASSTPIRSST
jgi:hypothetical protein